MSIQEAPPPAIEDRPVEEESAGGAAPTVTGASTRTLWRRYRVVVVVAAVIIIVATAVALAQSRGAGGRLDPEAAGPDGGRALATLLGDRGVQVRRVTDPDAAATDLGSGDAVFVGIPGQLTDSTARVLGDASQGTVVLVSPSTDVLDTIAGGIRTSSFETTDVRSPGCDDAAATAAGDALIGGRTYESETGTRCYGDADAAPMVVAATRGGARLVVLGTGEMLTNDRLDEDGNAALGLNLLGGDGSANQLRWLVPSPGASSDGESTSSILPDWVLPALLELAFAGLLLALWRGRRLGPPVVEPLPVVVRAAEAVEGRSRLYRRAQARDRAADALRSGALARMVPRLGIDAPTGAEPPPGAVVAAVASRSGQPDAAVFATLFGPPPVDDAGLVALADSLDSIVRDTLDPEGPHQ
ncbi:MAG TPA: DUF4350 domain-containing protein [Mycobacteriales bacterium]|jgi:hypothetical protein|nr:DUF4350 domain-containing protein [Mycobacteriales bacterium]